LASQNGTEYCYSLIENLQLYLEHGLRKTSVAKYLEIPTKDLIEQSDVFQWINQNYSNRTSITKMLLKINIKSTLRNIIRLNITLNKVDTMYVCYHESSKFHKIQIYQWLGGLCPQTSAAMAHY